MQEMSFSNVLAAAFTLVAMQYQDRAASPSLPTLSKPRPYQFEQYSVPWTVGSSQQSRGCALTQGAL